MQVQVSAEERELLERLLKARISLADQHNSGGDDGHSNQAQVRTISAATARILLKKLGSDS
jgi:hypothetical protein